MNAPGLLLPFSHCNDGSEDAETNGSQLTLELSLLSSLVGLAFRSTFDYSGSRLSMHGLLLAWGRGN